MQNTEIFQKEYNKLNDEQKQAVDTIYGPVMVIAGPGAGKTQILALRAANIILKTGTHPENILITTFTDAGVLAIKKRLKKFLGNLAYKINVSTIHSLCLDIISSFPEKFVEYKAGTLIDEIESLEIIKIILDKMIEEGKIVELKSDADRYIYLRDIKSKITTLKQEAINPDYFKIKIEEENAKLQEELDLVKNKTTKTFAIKKESARKYIAKLYELREIYIEFNDYCKTNLLYDFSDLINFVLEKIKIDEELKYYYMEKFQFIMIDEYQDTNNSQNEILKEIASSEFSNIMVVGDDDQSIYRFQGANIENMLDFSIAYPETKFIVMDKNYRSNQCILDTRESLIKNNKERLSSKLTFLNKNLTRVGEYKDIFNKPKLFAAINPLAEKAFVLQKIREFTNIPPQEIAIIVRNNKEVEEWSNFLNQNGIVVESKRKTDVLKNPYVLLLLDILEIIDNPFADDYKLLNFLRSEVCEIDNIDVLNINKSLYNINYSRKEKIPLFSYLKTIAAKIENGEILNFEIKNKESIYNTIDFIANSISGNFASKPLYQIVSFVLEKLNFIEFVEKNGDFSDLEDIYTFFNKIKTWNEKDKELNIPKLLRKIKLHKTYNINIPRQILKENTSGVQVLTAHGSKGLEYEVVFIPGLYSGNWDNKKNIDKLRLPNLAGNGLQNTKESSEEEDRRLFFVALTRAKNHLFLSYPLSSDDKLFIESLFLGEIKENLEEIKDAQIDTSKVVEVVKNDLVYHKTKLKDEELDYIKTFLNNYKLSPSDLDTFINSPLDFLHRVIFKYPFVQNEFTIFGSVYHRVLELFYIKYKDLGVLPEKSYLTETFKLLIKREILSRDELERLTEKGVNGLSGYYEHISGNISVPLFLEYNFMSRNIVFDGIPLTGKIDKVEIIGESKEFEENLTGQTSLFERKHKKLVRFVDYKTGRVKSENEIKGLTQNGEGGYFRQLLFYYLMASLDKEFMAKNEIGGLAIDFVEGKDGKYKLVDISYSSEDVENLKQIIKDSRSKISDLEFWRKLI